MKFGGMTGGPRNIHSDFGDDPYLFPLFHGRSRTAYLHRCVWSGITGR